MKRNTHEKTMAAMDELIQNKLNQMVAEKMTAVLQAEGALTMEALRDKCTTVAKLSDELLQGHLNYAVEKGLIVAETTDGILRYHAAK